jgi:hypothetical protein
MEATHMTIRDTVKLVDPTSKVCTWGNELDGQGYWVKGNGWETKITYSEERAWELAGEEISRREVAA